MKTTYKVTVPKEFILAKRVKLTVSLSKFHIDEYVGAWEAIEFGGSDSKTDPAYNAEARSLCPGDLFQVINDPQAVEVLPGQFLVPYYSVLCKVTGTVVEE